MSDVKKPTIDDLSKQGIGKPPVITPVAHDELSDDDLDNVAGGAAQPHATPHP